MATVKNIQMPISSESTFLQIACTKDVIINALVIALAVGTLIGAINHGPALLNGTFDPGNLAQVLITYLVPFSVSVWTSVKTIRRFCIS